MRWSRRRRRPSVFSRVWSSLPVSSTASVAPPSKRLRAEPEPARDRSDRLIALAIHAHRLLAELGDQDASAEYQGAVAPVP
jgi:hypothetical protein